MEELLIVNPRRRRRKGRSAAQRRATAKLLAYNRARRGTRARRNPRGYGPGLTMHGPGLGNPRRRRTRARYRRNPAALLGRFGRIGSQQPMQIVQNAAIGAVGAIALQAVLTRLPLPTALITGRTRYLTQGAVALGLGMLAANLRIANARVAAQAAEGALTVTLADAIKDFAAAAGFPLAGMGYYLPGVGVRQRMPSAAGSPAVHMGKYITGPGSGNVLPLRRTIGTMRSFAF